MIYEAFAHVPIYGLEALGFVAKGEAGPFIAEGNTEPGGRPALNTNGGWFRRRQRQNSVSCPARALPWL
jgi:acetyl-CoA acetyltransferase